MNRISRRSAAEAAEALLEVGRTEPVLQYDVELGLARHHHWLRSGAPLPEWASAGVGPAASSLIGIKTLVSAVVIGALAVAGWNAQGSRQPLAAEVERPSPRAELAPPVAPSVPDLAASEVETAPVPIPVPNHDLTHEPPPRRNLRPDAGDKRAARVQPASKDVAPARAASAQVEPPAPRAEPVDATPARASLPAAPERKPVSAAERATRPEPGPQAQAPDELVEMQEVATAEQLLERSPARALALVQQGDRRFARGYFKQERAYIAIMALIRLGRTEEARARAASFARQFPALPYGARIRSALEAREAGVQRAAPRGATP